MVHRALWATTFAGLICVFPAKAVVHHFYPFKRFKRFNVFDCELRACRLDVLQRLDCTSNQEI